MSIDSFVLLIVNAFIVVFESVSTKVHGKIPYFHKNCDPEKKYLILLLLVSGASNRTVQQGCIMTPK